MDEFIGDFVADVQDGFDRIRLDLSLWEASTAQSDALNAIFRFVHTVTGNAAFLGFERFERLCKPVEAALFELRDGAGDASPQRIQAIVALVRRMHDIATAIDSGVDLSAADEGDMVRAIGYEPATATASFTAFKRAKNRAGTIRLSVEQFETLMSSIEELEAAHRCLLDVVAHMASPSMLNPSLFNLSSAIAATGQALARSRKQPLATLFHGLDRLAVQTAEKIGKSVELVMEAGDILVDRELIEGLRDCFVHIVRNAVDHGIEHPADRVRAGKCTRGRITISAAQSPRGLTLCVADDGRGVDAAQIAGIGAECNREALCDALTRPGFSTAIHSEVSGRGVGLDVVRTQITCWGGQLSIEPNPHKGMAITLFIPDATASEKDISSVA